MGICGGYQMLGDIIHDPLGIEGVAGSEDGLGLLSMSTTLEPEKQLKRVSGVLNLSNQPRIAVAGYEIHAGITQGRALSNSLLTLNGEPDGAVSEDNQIAGTYLHGLFDQPDALEQLLLWAGLKNVASIDYAELREHSINRLADAVETHLDLKKMFNSQSIAK